MVLAFVGGFQFCLRKTSKKFPSEGFLEKFISSYGRTKERKKFCVKARILGVVFLSLKRIPDLVYQMKAQAVTDCARQSNLLALASTLVTSHKWSLWYHKVHE